MQNSLRKIIGAGFTGCTLAILAGCAVVGGVIPDSSVVTIDSTTLDTKLSPVLYDARKIAIVSQEKAAVFAAQKIELSSNFEVALLAPPEASSPSQLRRHMMVVCEGSEQPDIVLSFGPPESDAGTGTTVKGVLIGRVQHNVTFATELLQCSSGWRTTFTTLANMDQGVYSSTTDGTDRMLGEGFSGAFLKIAR
jgi:plastocyanin